MHPSDTNPAIETALSKSAEAPQPGTALDGIALPADPVAAILDVLRRGERFLVCSHSRPDGDAVGTMLAMGMLLQQLGKRADLVTADRIPATYRNLPGAESIRSAMRVHGPYDAVILLECDGARPHLPARPRTVFPGQHRPSRQRPRLCPLNWIDSFGGQRRRTGLPARPRRRRHHHRRDGHLPLHHHPHRYGRLLLRRTACLHLRPGASSWPRPAQTPSALLRTSTSPRRCPSSCCSAPRSPT